MSQTPDDDPTDTHLPLPPFATIAPFPRPALLTLKPAPTTHAPPRRPSPRADRQARAYFLLNLALVLLIFIGLILLVARTPTALPEAHAIHRT